jgi:O-antigen/teichoic acid export membrane protein
VLDRLRSLGKSLTVYGIGDVATSVISFLLLPLYARFLTPADYGAIGLLLTVEVVAKIVFRFGIDASFMRLWVDCADDQARQRLASTLFWFLAAVDGTVLAACLAATPWLTAAMGVVGYDWALRIVLLNTFVIGFYFIPFHVLRMTDQAATFVALTTTRSAATLLVRFGLVVGASLGVTGFVLTDLVVTTVFTLVMLPWFRPYIRLAFSRAVLKDALRFGLPRVPHGIAQQVMFVADRNALRVYSSLSEVGLFQMGASFGMAMKLVLNSFEYAWAPFYFQTMKQPDAKATFRLITTYGFAMLVLLEAGLAAVGPEVVRYVLPPQFHAAARIVPWIGLGVAFHGVYLLTSIGLNITKNTRYYPVATMSAAATSVAANVILVPRFGAIGAAWANATAYGVMATTAFVLSQRVYPIALEYGRLARILAAGLGALAAALALPAMPPLAAGLARGVTVVVVWPVLLGVLGFFDARELRTLGRLLARVRAGRTRPIAASPIADATVADLTLTDEPALVDDPALADERVPHP